ncbi:MAG: methyltransferase [Bacteriovoracaceae bacterium]|nr:methyltransferase [Bacteriovoracaceae bacterium]
MNLVQQFNQIRDFLNIYHFLWKNEILNHYPNRFPDFFEAWVDELMDFSDEELAQLEGHYQVPTRASDELKKYYATICELMPIPIFEFTPQKLQLVKIKEKKEHELQGVAELMKELKFQRVIEFGGGVGHGGEFLSEKYSKEVISLDHNEYFQDLGRKRLVKYPKEIQLIFEHMFISPEQLRLKNWMNKDVEALCLGLHACGSLSNHLMDFFHESKASYLLNFGCCYEKYETPVNLSQVAKKAPLPLTTEALHFAARSYVPLTQQDIIERKKVKHHRYLLQFYLAQKNLAHGPQTLGSASHEDYQLPWADYANKQLSKLGFEAANRAELTDFAAGVNQQKLYYRYFLAGLLRNALGRLIELYIVLDRAMYLEDLGHEARIYEVFDRHISPRNIALLAVK